MAKTKDALKILERVTGNDTALRRRIEREMLKARVSMLIYDARTQAGLSQARLAKLVGTTQSVIARLEDAEYRGHSLTMLQRIAAALNRRVEVRFVPLKGNRRAA